MSFPSGFITPIQGFLGGVGLGLSASLLLFTNGRTLGISGFAHRTFNIRNGWQKLDALGTVGLIAGGVVVGALESKYAPSNFSPFKSLDGFEVLEVAASGFLIGLGSRLQNGCTSGHMMCGVSRLSRRSIVATAIFFPVAALTAQIHRNNLPIVKGWDWSIGALGPSLLSISAALLVASTATLLLASRQKNIHPRLLQASSVASTFISAFVFSLSLRLSTLNNPQKVLSFLILPFPDSSIFDPTLFFLGISATPIAAGLYRLGNWLRKKNSVVQLNGGSKNGATESTALLAAQARMIRAPVPVLGNWPNISNGEIDRRLVIGAVIFGIGWGFSGVCPGPALVNIGRSLYTVVSKGDGTELGGWLVWLLTFVVGGWLVV